MVNTSPSPENQAATSCPLNNKEVILRVMPMPSDANPNGDIFGGWLMSQVDIAGAILAARRAQGRVATVAVNSFIFKKPIYIGDVVSFYGEIIKIGNTSITLSIEVYAERHTHDGESVRVTDATLTYVKIGADGKPQPLPILAG